MVATLTSQPLALDEHALRYSMKSVKFLNVSHQWFASDNTSQRYAHVKRFHLNGLKSEIVDGQ